MIQRKLVFSTYQSSNSRLEHVPLTRSIRNPSVYMTLVVWSAIFVVIPRVQNNMFYFIFHTSRLVLKMVILRASLIVSGVNVFSFYRTAVPLK